ncbi:hypothetical protein GCM10009549_11610 [Streptomyces thermoalcalitolerans]|uniref:Uncharacterized protein n=1 Tax=Streptomyces thermoalcalitolerans TaxID=65605 RepID=A0ABN1NH25_9ACTN
MRKGKKGRDEKKKREGRGKEGREDGARVLRPDLRRTAPPAPHAPTDRNRTAGPGTE